MEKYQKELIDIINTADYSKLITTRQSGKSLYDRIKEEFVMPPFILLENHWEFPGMIRVDCRNYIGNWIESHDITTWKPDVCTGDYTRYIISPELFVLLKLKFS